MSETRDEMLPCPFCGGKAEADDQWQGYTVGWYVDADHDGDCPLRSLINEAITHETKADAIAAWNRRATLPREEPGEVERLREAIEPLVGAAMQFARDEPFVVAQMKRKDFAEAIAKRALSSLSPAPVQAEGMREALVDAAKGFRLLGGMFKSDGSIEGKLRSERAEKLAQMCDAALSQAPRPSEGGGADV